MLFTLVLTAPLVGAGIGFTPQLEEPRHQRHRIEPVVESIWINARLTGMAAVIPTRRTDDDGVTIADRIAGERPVKIRSSVATPPWYSLPDVSAPAEGRSGSASASRTLPWTNPRPRASRPFPVRFPTCR